MADSERKLDKVDPNFSAMQGEGNEVEIFFRSEDDPTPQPIDSIDGFLFEYTEAEMTILGGGDMNLGIARVTDFMKTDERSLEEKLLDNRKPLQDELDALMLPLDPGPRPN